ncbi:hypothetical protein JK358_38480, partial [Nocardia sp. 2]
MNPNHPTRPTDTLYAADLTRGMIMPISSPDRPALKHACQIEKTRTRLNGNVYLWGTMLHGPYEGRRAHVICPGHSLIRVLTSHYGVCGTCGGLAPCPDETADYELRALLASID